MIINIKDDNRPYAEVEICGIKIIGLLDSGAQASIAGAGFTNIIKKLNLRPISINSIISTADGTSHEVPFSYCVPITYNGVTKEITIMHSENVEKKLILGIDFWTLFHIRTIVCDSIEVNKQISTTHNHELSIEQAQELQTVLKKMPFSKEGVLTKTHLITHTIDTGNSLPIKQRHYIVSPYIQSAINSEIDRLLSLDVIESCDPGPWSSPIVAVKKRSVVCGCAETERNYGKRRVSPTTNQQNSWEITWYEGTVFYRLLGRLPSDRVRCRITNENGVCYKRSWIF